MEIDLGFFKKSIEKPKELFIFAFLMLQKKDMTGTKKYGKFQISSKGLELLELAKGEKGQTIGISYLIEENKFVLINTTGHRDHKNPNVSLVSKTGTFSQNKMYTKICEIFKFDSEQDNHLKLTTATDKYTIDGNNLPAVELEIVNVEESKDNVETVEDKDITDMSMDDAVEKFEQEIANEVAEAKEILDDTFDADDIDL